MWLTILGIIANTTIIYILIIVGIRILGKKELGDISVVDLIFIMLVSEAVGDVLRSSEDTLLGAAVAVATLVALNRLLDLLLYRSPAMRCVVEGTPAVLIRHGKPNLREMKRNRITLEDLEQAGRQNGIGDIGSVELAILEVDGRVSFLSSDRPLTSQPIVEEKR